MTTALDLSVFDVNRFGPGQCKAAWRDYLNINNDTDPQVASWTPTITANGSMTVSAITVYYARYNFDGKKLEVQVGFVCTTGGTASNQIRVTMPAGWEQNDVVVGDITLECGSGHADDPPARQDLVIFTENTQNYFRVELDSYTGVGGDNNFDLTTYTIRFSAETEVRAV